MRLFFFRIRDKNTDFYERNNKQASIYGAFLFSL